MAITTLMPYTTLRPAADVKDVAEKAAEVHELQQLAYAINTAADTGELQTVYEHAISDNAQSTLELQGYQLTPYKLATNGAAYIISWK